MRLRIAIAVVGLIVGVIVGGALVTLFKLPINDALKAGLVSGALAAVFTGVVSLSGVSLTLAHQSGRDRVAYLRSIQDRKREQIRAAYVMLLRAADQMQKALTELMEHPQGRAQSFGPLTFGLLPYDPHYVANDALDKARQLFLEAEIILILEDGPDNEVLKAYNSVEAPIQAQLQELQEATATISTRRKAELQASIDKVYELAHKHLAELEAMPA